MNHGTYYWPLVEVSHHFDIPERRLRSRLRVHRVDGIACVVPSQVDALLDEDGQPRPVAAPERTISGEELRARRRALGLRCNELSVRIGRQHQTISRMERGELRIPPTMDRLLRALEHPAEAAYTGRLVDGAGTALYRLDGYRHGVVAADCYGPVRLDQLAPDFSPPRELVLDKALSWQPAPLHLPAPIARYRVHEKNYVFVLALEERGA